MQGESRFESLKPYLSAHLRQASDRGERITVDTETWKKLAESHAHTPVTRKLDLVLRYCADRSDNPGASVALGPEDFVLFDARNLDEASYLVDTLVEQGDLRRTAGAHGRLIVTARGWRSLSQVLPGGVPGTCFVAMSFEDELDPAFDDGIRPAIEADCGFKVIRVDRVEHNDNINDKIIADLRAAQFVVADFTRHRNGVYFEAGFALGLGRVVIFTCRSNDFEEKVHFDTRPYNHILWSTPAELRRKLTTRIRATVANTPRMQDK